MKKHEWRTSTGAATVESLRQQGGLSLPTKKSNNQEQKVLHGSQQTKTSQTSSKGPEKATDDSSSMRQKSRDDDASEDEEAAPGYKNFYFRPLSAAAGRRSVTPQSQPLVVARERPTSANAQHRGLHSGGADHGELQRPLSAKTNRYFEAIKSSNIMPAVATQKKPIETPPTAVFSQAVSQEQREELQRLLAASALHRRGLPDIYAFGKVIGVGSFGTVRLGYHKLTGQLVAIKTYERSKMKDPQQWKRVQQEARVMEKLSDCALICRFLEAFETGSPRRAHLIMEYLPGGSLCSHVKAKRRLPENETRPLMLQLAMAIDHMHLLNVVHRDIKLENILFADDSKTLIRVIDFGFSTRCAPERRLRLFCGTPSYMPPEIVRRTEYRGKPIDLWSFGVVAYACLAGSFPFAARSQSDLYRKILRGTFRLPEGQSVHAASLVEAAINVDVLRRITAPEARRHAWLVEGNAHVEKACTTLGPLTRSQDYHDDLLKEPLANMEKAGVPRDALLRAVAQADHSPITACYYLLMGNAHRPQTSRRSSPSYSSSAGGVENNNRQQAPTSVPGASTTTPVVPPATG